METTTVGLLSSPEEIRHHLTATLPDGGYLKGVSLFCTCEHDSHVLCLLDIDGVSASTAAMAVKGQPFGFSSVVITMPIAGTFTCRQRRVAGDVPAHCTCTPVHPGERPRLAFD